MCRSQCHYCRLLKSVAAAKLEHWKVNLPVTRMIRLSEDMFGDFFSR